MTEQTFSVFENGTIEASLQTGAISPNMTLAALQADSFQQIDPETFSMQYRALSQSLIYQQGLLGQVVTDFSRSGVLRKSAGLLQNITIMADHEFSAGRYIGKVVETNWTRKINNTNLPGLNATIRFDDDPKAQPDLRHALRGIKKNYLNGFSVSVWFEYEKSHPDLDPLDFCDQMGSELDGEIVRFIVTKILRYLEASIVVAGADPHAQPIRSTQNAASLAASFSLTNGWSLPETSQISVATYIPYSTNSIIARDFGANDMPRKKKADLEASAEENQVAEDLQEEEDNMPSEELEEVNPPDVSETEDSTESDVSENTVNVNINSQQGFSQADLDAAVAEAVADKEAELAAERAKTENLEKTQHHTNLTIFWEDLKRDTNLAASFDEFQIVDFMVALSTEATDGNPSQLDQFKAILKEAAKFATVPTEPVGDKAREPHGANKKAALRQAAIQQKLEEDPKRSEHEAMRLAAQDDPELFREGD